jgi:hypothetical protein
MFAQLLERLARGLDQAGLPYMILAGRPRDLEDVQGILLKQPHTDLAAIRQRLNEFSQTLNQPLVEQFDQLRKHLLPSWDLDFPFSSRRPPSPISYKNPLAEQHC